MNKIKKTLLTLALLITAVGGAWAQETPLLTIESKDYTSFKSGSMTFDDKVTVTFSDEVKNTGNNLGWYTRGSSLLTVAGTNGYTITSCKFYTNAGVAATGYTVEGESPSVYLFENNVYTDDSKSLKIGETGITKIEVYTAAAATATTVPLTWDAATPNTATLTNGMPAGNVTVSVEYFAQAEFAMSTDPTPVALAPTAIDGVPANTDDPIVTPGTVANIGTTDDKQGTLMYFVSQSTGNTVPDAPTYTTEGWTDKVPTANGLQEGNAYVWYYIKGAEPANIADRTDDNTRNDSDIKPLGTTGIVTLLPEPTYTVEFAEGTNPEAPTEPEWTATPNTGVKKGQTVTVTYSGTRKVIGVKAEKKVEPNKLTVGNVTFYYDEGQTFTEAKQKYADLNSGWILNGPYISVQGAISIVLFKGDSPVEGTSKIEPNAEYSWIDFS